MNRWVLATALLSMLGSGCAVGSARSGADEPDTSGPTGPHLLEDEDHHRGGSLRPRRLRGSEDWRLDRPAQPGGIEAFTTRSSGEPGTRSA